MRLNQAVFLAALVLASGCIPVPVPTETKFERTGNIAALQSHEAIAVLIPAELTSESTFTGAEECLKEGIRTKYPELNIISSEEFRRSVFGYRIPPGTTRAKYFQLLYSQPAIQKRIHALRLRYIFFLENGLETKTQVVSETDAMWKKGWPVGALILERERSSALKMTIYEVGGSDATAEIKTHATGQAGSAVAVYFPFFLGVVAVPFTESSVCEELGANIDQFLAVETNPGKARSGTNEGQAQQ